MASAKHTLIVAGDVVVDHHLYQGERPRPTTDGYRGVHTVRQVGGAVLLKALIDQLLSAGCEQTGAAVQPAWDVRLGVTTPLASFPSGGNQAYAVLRPFPRVPADPDKPNDSASKDQVWRIAERMGYGEADAASDSVPLATIDNLPPAKVLVLDDAGLEFRNPAKSSCWHLGSATSPPRWVLLKMSGPLARGKLWNELIGRYADRLVCVVSSDDLRQEKLRLGRGLSWERTVEEVWFALQNAVEFGALRRCAHLIVTFSADGALWIDLKDPNNPPVTLVFDAGGADGEFIDQLDGGMIGFQTVMAAALARALAQHAAEAAEAKLDLGDAITRGLRGMRDLMVFGHGTVGAAPDKKPTAGYPIEQIRDVLLKPDAQAKPGEIFARASIPRSILEASAQSDRPGWMIIEMLQSPAGARGRPSLFGVACDLLVRGTNVVLTHFPHARFGNLTTVDREEIEALRNIRRLMRDYKSGRYQDDPTAIKPLSLGVFGPPGAGKSFGVKQIANQVFGKESWLEFNLSQFSPPNDLIGALHQVRDLVLRGKTPVVFWDEFDSREFEWLQYLLAPMQDGRFQEGQISHPVGKCVFIFAGGTSESYEDFKKRGDPGDPGAEAFKLRKGPDFRSRLDSYYDVLGPNQRQLPAEGVQTRARAADPSDQSYVLRRALLIHSMLRTRGAPLADLDEGLAHALLRLSRYKNGARSLEKLVVPLRPGGNEPVRRSRLPSQSQLAMHVECPREFARLLATPSDSGWLLAIAPAADPLADPALTNWIEPLAVAVHTTWRDLIRRNNWTRSPRYDRDFVDLQEVDKEDNRAAARRIPWILGLAGLAVAKANQPAAPDEPSEDLVTQLLDNHIERLAEAEHEGWMDYRRKTGWRCGKPRNDDKQIHPGLVAYSKLSDDDKEKDRNTVRHFPEFVGRAGCRIIWLGSGVPDGVPQ